MEETLQDARDALAGVDEMPAIQCVQEALDKGARLPAERQKLIKIADCLENC